MRPLTPIVASLLLVGPAYSQADPYRIYLSSQTQNELPGMPQPLMQGVTLHFRGEKQPSITRGLGEIQTGRVGVAEVQSLGLPLDEAAKGRAIHCPNTIRAAAVKLAQQAKAMGADAVTDVRSLGDEPRGPSALCLVLHDRQSRQPFKDQTYAVTLVGVAVVKGPR